MNPHQTTVSSLYMNVISQQKVVVTEWNICVYVKFTTSYTSRRYDYNFDNFAADLERATGEEPSRKVF